MAESSDENVWALIAWAASIAGAIVCLILRPTSRYVKYWSYLSISFFIIALIGYVAVNIIGIILDLFPHVGSIVSTLIFTVYFLVIFVIWVVGIIRSISGIFWKPRYIYDFAIRLGIEKI